MTAALNPILVAVFALGFSCMLTQLALLREMVGVFAGNELVLGVTLGNWLLLMGLGATLARRLNRWNRSPTALGTLLMLTALLPPVQIVALRALRGFVFLRGEAVGVVGTITVSFLVLMPYCLAAGLFLASACQALAAADPAEAAGRVYAVDTLGSVVGGALFSLVLVFFLDHIALLTIPALLNCMAATWLGHERGARPSLMGILAVVAGGGLLSWACFAQPDATTTARQFPGQRVLFRGNSPYGRLVVTASGDQTNVIENGAAIASTPNIEAAEESVHLALAQRPNAQRVLLIGGAISGATREILRHRVASLDCVELDPLILEVGRRFLPTELDDPRLKLWDADARQFVRNAAPGYDAVLVALPDPTTAQLNRFYTDEFFQDVRRVLKPGGILSFATGHYENYASPELSKILSCAKMTAARTFRNVLLLPGGRVYFVASDTALTTDIGAALDRAGVTRRWVNHGYLAANFTPDRLSAVEQAAGQPAPINHDFSPVLYFLHLRHWASQFDTRWRWLIVLCGMAAAVYLSRLRSITSVLFASGFAATALEVVLLLAMQALAGALYRQIAWLITIFMAGLTLGALAGTRWVSSRDRRLTSARLCGLALTLAALAALLPWLIHGLTAAGPFQANAMLTQTVILGFTFALATVIGGQFPLANALAGDPHAAGRLYSADFVGAFAGALSASIWLVPLAGATAVCWVTGGLNVIAAAFLFANKNHR